MEFVCEQCQFGVLCIYCFSGSVGVEFKFLFGSFSHLLLCS